MAEVECQEVFLEASGTDNGPAQLIALRLLIGLFEAGFYPTALFYLSSFYTRFDLAVRIAIFYGQYAIAGAFSGAIGTLSLSTVFALSCVLTSSSIRCIPLERRSVQLAISLHH
jgi:MFS family permease